MYTSILLATDLSEAHYALCEQAKNLALQLGATLYLLHVIETPASMQLAQGLGFSDMGHPAKEDAETVMNTLGEALQIPPSQQFVEIGSIQEHTITKIEALGCNLLIIGSNHKHQLPSFLGNTTRGLMEHATCDVLTIRTTHQA